MSEKARCHDASHSKSRCVSRSVDFEVVVPTGDVRQPHVMTTHDKRTSVILSQNTDDVVTRTTSIEWELIPSAVL